MTVMLINDIVLADDRPLTADDLERLPNDGNRYELVYGVLEVTPGPFGDHEDALHRLNFLLELHCPPDLMVAGGQGVNLYGDPTRHRVPDTSVVRRAEFEPKFQVRPALLAVEVASASTARRDREVKRVEYEQFGIQSYWIVVPDEKHPSLTAYDLADGRYVQVAHVIGDEIFHAERPFAIDIAPRRLVTRGEWKRWPS